MVAIVRAEYLKLKNRKNTDLVMDETFGELEKAFKIADTARRGWNEQWPDILRYVQRLPRSWKLGDSYVDLNMLSQCCKIDS
jgi:hypothetical protein